MKKKIVFLINSLAGGGAERAVINILSNSKDELREFDVSLVLLDVDTIAYVPPANIKTTVLDTKGSLFSSVIKLNRLFRVDPPDVVVSALTRSNIANIISSWLLNHNTILCEHAHTSGHHLGHFGWLARFLVRHTYPHAGQIVAVSRDIKGDLVANFGVLEGKTTIVSNPINLDVVRQRADQWQVEADRPYILGMGRLVKSKNFPLLLEAFAASRFRGDLWILGQGPESRALNERAKALGVDNRVRFLGFNENPFPFLKSATAFVLPSNGEGLPTSIIEAFALGTPVISTDCHSGPAELLNDDVYGGVYSLTEAKFGLLVPTNQVKPMADAISSLTDPNVLSDLRLKSIAGMSRYGLQPAVKRYWDLIRQIGSNAP